MSVQEMWTVVGAGHGGKTMAAHLGLMGVPVTLYNRTAAKVEAIKVRGGIELAARNGGPRGFGRIERVTSDMAEALAASGVIMVVVPATAHRPIAQAMAPHLRDGQILVLNPGRTGGCLEFVKTLRDQACQADVTVAEAETLLYACRSEGPVQARILRMKDAVPLAALPATRTSTVLDALRDVFPQFIDGQTVLHTGLDNMGAIFHPALTLLNAGRIESTGGRYQFYIDGVTPSVARVLERLDRERVTVASSLGIRARTALEWLSLAYDATGDTLHDAIHNQMGYHGITAPATLNHRYITEDVPMSLVPIAALGERYGVAVPAIRSLIRLAGIIHQTDYERRGRTLDVLGIEQLSADELIRFVSEGQVSQEPGDDLRRVA
ncbi:MAG: NAD/NADP octopine/nopaline dehydrogenase family protein [Anaerolineae bacterium]|nr:NAD/NADP octopine/nopaline dehydrogenase family protein [Anaerolineae bacterium]